MGNQGGQGAGSSAEHARTVVREETGVAKEAASAEGGLAAREVVEGAGATRVVGSEAAGTEAVDPEESVQKAAKEDVEEVVEARVETT